jgi:hypothetical protein
VAYLTSPMHLCFSFIFWCNSAKTLPIFCTCSIKPGSSITCTWENTSTIHTTQIPL